MYEDIIKNNDDAEMFLFAIYNADIDEPLVTIEMDGTVVIHEYGAEKEAAEIFWSALHFYGKDLIQQVSDLEAENKCLKNKLKMYDEQNDCKMTK